MQNTLKSSNAQTKTQEANLQANKQKLSSQNLTQTLLRIFFLAMSEREKSLKFYTQAINLPNLWALNSQNIINNANVNASASSNSSLGEIFVHITQKEREILTNAEEILREICESEAKERVSDYTALIEQIIQQRENTLLLPSALPNDILGELLDEMDEIDSKSLMILALGIESHHLKTSDFLIKATQNLLEQDLQAKNIQDSKNPNTQNPQNTINTQNLTLVLDTLYQLQALSYNHHIALLQGELAQENMQTNLRKKQGHQREHQKENLAQNPQDNLLFALLQILQGVNPNTNAKSLLPASLQDIMQQSPFFSQITTSINQIQDFYTQTKAIVQKLEKGELSQNELVAFLKRLRF